MSRANEMPVDEFDNPLPWYTYPSISFLAPRIHLGMKIFEYGSGNSTLWWASKVSSIVSCEHDIYWYDQMLKLIPPNVNYQQRSLGDPYAGFISEFDAEFDIVVLDGRERVNCTYKSIHALKNNGVIIFDNSDRKQYSPAYQFLSENEFKRLDFYGLGPCGIAEWCTSIFYRKENCLNI